MVGTKHQVSFSNNKHLVIGCQVCQPIREEEIKTLLFSDWFTDLTTNHKVFVFRKRNSPHNVGSSSSSIAVNPFRCKNLQVIMEERNSSINLSQQLPKKLLLTDRQTSASRGGSPSQALQQGCQHFKCFKKRHIQNVISTYTK